MTLLSKYSLVSPDIHLRLNYKFYKLSPVHIITGLILRLTIVVSENMTTDDPLVVGTLNLPFGV